MKLNGEELKEMNEYKYQGIAISVEGEIQVE